MNSEELDVDFENFTVSKEKAAEIRTSLDKVKELKLATILKNLVSGLGVEEKSDLNDQVATLIKAKNPKVFRAPLSSNKVFEVFMADQDLRCTFDGRPVLEISYLPKNKDFLLLYAEEDFINSWELVSKEIEDSLAEAEKIISDRAKRFKKFRK